MRATKCASPTFTGSLDSGVLTRRMERINIMRWFAVLALLPVVAFAFGPKPGPKPSPAKPTFATNVLPFMKKYCVGCHTGQYASDGVDLGKVKTAADAKKALATMKKAAHEVSKSKMPPSNATVKPTEAERKAFSDWVKAQK